MKLEFVKDNSKHYFVKRLLNHDEELTIGIIQHDLMTNSLTYFAWVSLDTFFSLPSDEQKQIKDFIVSHNIDPLEFIE